MTNKTEDIQTNVEIVKTPGAPATDPSATKVGLPVRGTFPNVFISAVDGVSINDDPGSSRSRVFQNIGLQTKKKVSAGTQPTAATTTATLTGVPKELTGFSISTEPLKKGGQVLSVVTAQWNPPANDIFFSYADIWVTGYNGNASPQLVASGTSPLVFPLIATGESVTFTAVAASSSGKTAAIANAPAAGATLSQTTGNPPPPTISQLLTSIPGGYQFSFNFLSGLLTTIIASYNIYRNTSNTFAGSTKIRTVPQDQTQTGAYVFQDNVGTFASTTLYYFITSVDIFGNESATAVSAQTGAVVTSVTLDNIPDGALYSKLLGTYISGGDLLTVTIPGAITNPDGSMSNVNQVRDSRLLGAIPAKTTIKSAMIGQKSNATTDNLGLQLGTSAFALGIGGGSGPSYTAIFQTDGNFVLYKVISGVLTTLAAAPGNFYATSDTNIHLIELTVTTGSSNKIIASIDGNVTLTVSNSSINLTSVSLALFCTGKLWAFDVESSNLDNLADGTTFIKLSGVNADNTLHSSTTVNNQGSLVGIGKYNNGFSYTSTTTTVTWTWVAFTIYRPDGSSVSIGANSTGIQFTGLTASTTYYFGVYYSLTDGLVHIVKSDVSSGTTNESNQQVAQTVEADTNFPIATDMTAATPASGSGSGGGGKNIGCPAADQPIETKEAGFIAAGELCVGMHVRGWLADEWNLVEHVEIRRTRLIAVEIAGEELRVEQNHLWKTPTDWVETGKLTLGTKLLSWDGGVYYPTSIRELGPGEYALLEIQSRRMRIGRLVGHNFFT